MQKFSWKRKHETIKKGSSSLFSLEDEHEEKRSLEEQGIDWLDPIKKPKMMVLEDAIAKANRLKREGVILAESNKWWSAIKHWQGALSHQPNDHTLHEMMAQAYMQVGEYVQSISCAEECVRLAPLWWCGHQTLGRALMGIGELHKAVLSFSVSLRLFPDNSELREQDLKWASQLLATYKNLQKQNKVIQKTEAEIKKKQSKEEEEEPSVKIVDLKENPEEFSKIMESSDDDKTSLPNIPSTSRLGNVMQSSLEERSSITHSVRFISCCSKNKSGKNKAEGEPAAVDVDLSEMVCMRPKFPFR